MKTLFTISSIFLFVTTTSWSQTVNGVPLDSIDVMYVEITGKQALNPKYFVYLDYGQVSSPFRPETTRIMDEHGNKAEFNSMIDALNFMSDYGYEFVTTYAKSYSNHEIYNCYLLRRKEID